MLFLKSKRNQFSENLTHIYTPSTYNGSLQNKNCHISIISYDYFIVLDIAFNI